MVPAHAHLQRHRHRDGAHRRREQPPGRFLVAHQRGAGLLADRHLLHRAAEIDVDQVGARPTAIRAASAIASGSQPASCTALGPPRPPPRPCAACCGSRAPSPRRRSSPRPPSPPPSGGRAGGRAGRTRPTSAPERPADRDARRRPAANGDGGQSGGTGFGAHDLCICNRPARGEGNRRGDVAGAIDRLDHPRRFNSLAPARSRTH